jgi:hypothetical protein
LVTFAQRHCAHCLTAEIEGKTIYRHAVLEAKLVTPNGLALSVASEFVENTDPKESRQDCELKAFYRLAVRLNKLFPQLSICVLLDGLYAVEPVLNVCRDSGWEYIITFKEGRAPAVFAEYESLRDMAGESAQTDREGRVQKFRWVNGVPYGRHPVNVLQCEEKQEGNESKRFVWVTSLRVDQKTYPQISNEGGRQRWRIENEGFNMQKNGGYGLEHAYSEGPALMKRFYFLLQIAHTIYQFLEKGLLRNAIKDVLGSIRNVARRLLEEIRTQGIGGIQDLEQKLSQRIQIRFDTS